MPVSVTNKLLVKQYLQVRNFSTELCKPLETEDYVSQPTTDVSPPKWHLAHTTWFFEEFVLTKYLKDYQVFDKQYGFLFNSYYQTVGDRWTRANRGALTRPTVGSIFAYRKYVDEYMEVFFKHAVIEDDLQAVLQVGLQHEQQHQELLLYDIKAILGYNPLFPFYKKAEAAPQRQKRTQWLKVDGGTYTIGHTGEAFCFDNELGSHQVHLMPFEIADSLVTCGEYLDFMNDGGYQKFNYWLSEGWDWAESNKIDSPEYWHWMDDSWKVYSLSGLKDLDPNEPVSHVSFFEADAYARWKGVRLPSEFEWEIACKKYEPEVPQEANFVDINSLNPLASESYQFYGNLWEWTESAYRPYPYFKVADGALGEYNGKFMINQMVLKGGSYATSANHIRATYRNFFHPHLRWMFSGIRLAKH